ncbi:hypothetical protein OB947_17345 [Aeromonas bestiarum]|uniref:hypothetical protein n=1 Tax=Aeromonas bestiarum TaxID=105751 RepID=UPI00259F729A|nr:hypothetical protein [Aeromonas bestiarum]MDM5090643.1 hypothetical protein [Aeromonas bestiarum]
MSKKAASVSICHHQQPATSNQQPATSNQQPATSNQQPATSNQQPATSRIFRTGIGKIQMRKGRSLSGLF